MKSFYKIGCALLFVIGSVAYSLPVNNPSAPKILEEGFFLSPGSSWSVRSGYEGSFVMDYQLKKDAKNKIDTFYQDTQAGSVTINFLNRCDIYGILGASRAHGHYRYDIGDNMYTLVGFDANYHFSWSAGMKAILFDWGKTNLEMGGRYFRSKGPLESLEKNGVPVVNAGASYHLHAWQIDLGISYKADIFTPYIAAKYSRLKSSINANKDITISSSGNKLSDIENKRKYGMALGCSLSTGKLFVLTAEARLIDEEAFTVSGELKF
jgi:opacity protein-like surface antigen